MKPYYFAFICIFICFSCSETATLPSIPTEHFAVAHKIHTRNVIELEQFGIFRPSKCIRYKNWYVLADYGDRDNHVCFLSTDLSKLVSGLREGNGPLDIVGSFDLCFVEDSLFVIDPNHKKILTVDVVADSLEVKVSSYDFEMGWPCMPITRDRFIGEIRSDSSMYQLEDRNGCILARINYPEDKNLRKLSYVAQNSIYVNTKFCVSPNKKKYAFGTSFTGMYGFGSIINQDSITLDKTLSYYSLDIQEIIEFGGDRVVPSEKSMVNVCSCTGSDKYAIFSFAGYRYGEMEKYAKSLLLYTWDGEPYMCLDIEDDNVSQIYYDSIRNVIVGIAHNPEAQLVEYDMKGIIK